MGLNYRVIGNRIGARRRFLGFGQEQLGQMVNLSKTHISNIENGRSIPSVEAIVNLSYALDTTPNALLLGADMEQSPVGRTLADQITSCSEPEQRFLTIVVEAVIEKSQNKG